MGADVTVVKRPTYKHSLLLEVTNVKPSLCDLRPNCESALNEYTSRRDDIKTEHRILQIEVVT